MKGNNVYNICIFLLLWMWPALGYTYTLTEADYLKLRTDITITNQSEFAQAVADNNDQYIADAYNQNAVPDFWVWRTNVPERQNYEATVEGKTWDWDVFTGLQPGQRDSWVRMNVAGGVNASLDNTRAGLNKIFTAAAGQRQIDFLLALWREKASRAEKLFADTTSGAGTTAAPAKMTFQGTIRGIDIAHSLRGAPIP